MTDYVKSLVHQYDNLIQMLTEQIEQAKAARASVMASDESPVPAVPVWLGNGVVMVDGAEIALLPGRESILVEAFAESPTHRLTTGEMERIGFPNPIGLKVIKQICRRYPALAPYITFPGVHNPGGAYHFRIIQSPERPV